MGRLMTALLIILAIAVVAVGYVRMAPSDTGRWHQMPEFSEDKNFKSGVMRVVDAGLDGLQRLDVIITQTPKTSVLDGSVAQGMVTYVTRSKVIGFPDYTTVRLDGDQLKIYARLRFGRSDMGVNKKRVDGWLAQLNG
ncbi:MAG: DUF1499 domain-containing protein [Rhodobacteraceae bacterium]|nr:DUF1499 domain-containing protein [Paracoccaceae bacterium]